MLPPLHFCNFKHTVWDKEKLLLISTVAPHDQIDMKALVLFVEIDKIENRGKVLFILSTRTESALAIAPVSRCGQKHGHTIHLAHSEEGGVLHW